jgi:hypothetical protein
VAELEQRRRGSSGFPSTGATTRGVGGRGTWWDRRWLTLVLDHAKEEGNGGPALFSRPPAVSRCSSFAFIISCRRLFQLPVRMVLGPIQRCSTQ